MERFRCGRRRTLAASIACLAFLLQGLVPSLAHALTGVARAQLYPGEICSIDPQGARERLARAIDAEAPAPTQQLPNAAHCPFCALPFGPDLALPNVLAWDFPRLESSPALPIVAFAPATPRPAQGRPQTPRAPPRS